MNMWLFKDRFLDYTEKYSAMYDQRLFMLTDKESERLANDLSKFNSIESTKAAFECLWSDFKGSLFDEINTAR